MLNKYLSLITLNSPSSDINPLIKHRNQASLPVGGRYRLIDFSLSNIVNSNITNVGIIGDLKNSNSLAAHIVSGAPWDLDTKNDGIFFLTKHNNNSFSTVNFFKDFEENFRYFLKSKQKYIILIDPSMACNIDIKKIMIEHESDERDVTVVYKDVNLFSEKFYQCDTIELNKKNEVTNFGTNLSFENNKKISLDIFIINKSKLIELIAIEIENQKYETFKHLIKNNLSILNIKGYAFNGYLAHIKSIKEYYDFNMDLLDFNIRKELFNNERPIYTKRKDTPSTIYKNESCVEKSLISNGCQIMGTVKNSVLGRRVIVDKGAIIENCIIMQNCHIKANSHLKNIIIDKGNIIPEGSILNSSPNYPFVIEKKVEITKENWNELIRGEKNE
ncbi:MAG: glucose-1-phosphate adenylyltransferase subunit GlgD [Fusobacteriaceae bacterium]